ncbi:uncharacterized protein Dere_GG10304 [Drosophila erecta]|uniref:SUN domain-containing protein n=2 Tax=Drosophila erecta TaxID=7220 RepID=B3N4H4_DROER|nr:uncharacterized protein Dere_GG10304 [Drosophila erecta]
MDGCRRARKRIFLTYLLSFVLLSSFFYYLMAYNSRNNLGIMRLREDVDDISHILRQQQVGCKGAQGSCKVSCAGGDPKGSCDHRDVSAYVDTLLKRKMGHLMDDVYNLKKQVMSADCSSKSGQAAPKPEAASLARPRINYASEDLGARIINVKAQPIGGTNFIKWLLGLDFSANPPVNMIRAALSPGACFGFNGSQATVTLQLAKTIVVEVISLTHVAREMTPSLCVRSAPKNFDVYGLRNDNSKKELLGQWSYDNAANRRTQSYSVRSEFFFRNLAFLFNSNHGANSTCIYR